MKAVLIADREPIALLEVSRRVWRPGGAVEIPVNFGVPPQFHAVAVPEIAFELVRVDMVEFRGADGSFRLLPLLIATGEVRPLLLAYAPPEKADPYALKGALRVRRTLEHHLNPEA